MFGLVWVIMLMPIKVLVLALVLAFLLIGRMLTVVVLVQFPVTFTMLPIQCIGLLRLPLLILVQVSFSRIPIQLMKSGLRI